MLGDGALRQWQDFDNFSADANAFGFEKANDRHARWMPKGRRQPCKFRIAVLNRGLGLVSELALVSDLALVLGLRLALSLGLVLSLDLEFARFAGRTT